MCQCQTYKSQRIKWCLVFIFSRVHNYPRLYDFDLPSLSLHFLLIFVQRLPPSSIENTVAESLSEKFMSKEFESVFIDIAALMEGATQLVKRYHILIPTFCVKVFLHFNLFLWCACLFSFFVFSYKFG